MDVVAVFSIIAGIICLGYLAELLFRKTNIPDVIFLIATGILIGTVLRWVGPGSFGVASELFTTFALVFLLFQGALNIDLRELFESLLNTSKLTVLSFFLTIAVVTCIGVAMGMELLLALLLGVVLGGTSSAVVIPLVNNLRLKSSGVVLMLESAISDVLCIVGAVTIINIFQTGSASAGEVLRQVLNSFLLAAFIGAAAGLLWIMLLDRYAHLKEAYMVGVATVMGVYAVVESPFVGASGAIAALVFGLAFGNSDTLLRALHGRKHRSPAPHHPSLGPHEADSHIVRDVLSTSARGFYAEVSFFVKVFFFVYLGILIDFSDPWLFAWAALITLAVFLARPLAVRMVFRKPEERERIFYEIMVPKGLAAAVLAQLAVQSEVPGAKLLVGLVLAVVLLSILLTSVLVFLVEKGWFRGFWAFLPRQPRHRPAKA